MSRRPSRRAVLAAGLPVVTGCLGLVKDGLRLGGVTLRNRRSERVDVWLQVYLNGAGVHDLTYSLDPQETVVVADSWPDRGGVYEVNVRPAGDPIDRFEYTSDDSAGECTVAVVDVRDESVTFGNRADPTFCDTQK
jgi:hypothetical protein